MSDTKLLNTINETTVQILKITLSGNKYFDNINFGFINQNINNLSKRFPSICSLVDIKIDGMKTFLLRLLYLAIKPLLNQNFVPQQKYNFNELFRI
jgi:hypothetical protein